MPSTVVINRLTAVNKEARTKVIDGLSQVARFSQELSGVTRYAITIPRDESDDKQVFVIEEYIDQAAFNGHIGSRAVGNLITSFSENALLESPPIISTFQTRSSYSRPEVLKAKDPYILIATFDYKEGTRSDALEGWQSVTSACQQTQPGTYVYIVSQDPNNADRVGSVAVYESEKYFWDVHVPGEAVSANKAKYGDIRTKTSLAYFKLVGGFLFNDKARSKL